MIMFLILTCSPFEGPYSNFAVGAALRTTSGEIFTGKKSRDEKLQESDLEKI